jgi:hypothetical protein
MKTYDTIKAFWHKESFERLMQEQLPKLLAARLPLTGYHFEPTGHYSCRVAVAIAPASGAKEIEVEYKDIPQPDEEGIFEIAGQQRVVMPVALQDELDLAEIRCVGKLLYDYIEAQLGEAPPNIAWDASLLRAWLPLDEWVWACFEQTPTYQRLDQTNWLARQTHLRRFYLPNRKVFLTPSHFGRVCPFETPEGSNMARILSIARGAEIREGRLAVVDDSPEAALGLTACMLPLLEHNDPFHVLMGTNMMRQWLPPLDPEPALVQTGNEPDVPDFWCGRNLLTAFISWGEDTFEEGIVLSETGAKRLSYLAGFSERSMAFLNSLDEGGGEPSKYPASVEPGDKLSNRHGVKGVVSRILPDDQMPHLADGTPVELIFHSSGLHSRMNFGQLREALLGRLARIEGRPVIVPPFRAPGESELRRRLAGAGLPEDGLEQLTLGRNGQPLARPGAVGWVYWGRLVHTARSKLQVSGASGEGLQWQGEDEYQILRDIGAFELLREQFHTRAAERDEAQTLAGQIISGTVEQADPPTAKFRALSQRLAVAGIQTTFKGERLTFEFRTPETVPQSDTNVLTLARPTRHPWLGERQLAEIKPFETLPEYRALVEANARLAHMLKRQAPESLIGETFRRLEERVRLFFEALLKPMDMRFGNRVCFSGRAVLVPGADLRLNQVGLGEEIAWTLFGPFVIRELGNEEAVEQRTTRATQVLDEIMARAWVLVNRQPSNSPTALLAFQPVRDPNRVIRLHPLTCQWLDADFDGDQAAVFLPITEAAQREAGERLSVAGHLARDPALLETLAPRHEAMWGLAYLSQTEAGRAEISQLSGLEVAAPNGFFTRSALIEALQRLLAGKGVAPTLERLERLYQRGLEMAKHSGASLNPFIGANLERAPAPESDDPTLWQLYVEQLVEQLAARTNFEDDIGPQLLAVKSEARGQLNSLAMLIGPQGVVADVEGRPVAIRRGYREGLTPGELYALVAGSRDWLADIWRQYEQLSRKGPDSGEPKSFNVLARARRAQHPGLVFARAAAIGESDPLVDIDSRLFVGLPLSPMNN